jgi:cysteine desulfurase
VKTGGKLPKKELIISPIEHPAIRESAFSLRDFGFEVKILPVTKAGVVEGETLAKAIGKQTLLVSVIAGNNQFGTRQDLASLGTICRERGVLFHTDASLFFGLYPLKVEKLGVDLATLSSPKIYGPKGVAALYVRKGVELYPQLHGGGQEEGRRSGSHNVPAAVGFAVAAKAAWQGREERKRHDQQLSQYFIKQVQARIVGVVLNGDLRHRLASNVHLSVLGVEGEALVLGLNDYGIAASSGSACSSRKLQADPALRALDLIPEEVHGSIRFFWHEWTKKADIDYLLDKLELVVKRLRRVSAYKVEEGKNE